MRRCCGASECTCAIKVGSGLTLTGNGSASTPYKIDAPPLQVGCGLTGTGQSGSPLAARPAGGSASWATSWSCDAAANSTLKCDPNTGQLWTPPEHSSAAATARQDHWPNSWGGPTMGVTGWLIADSNIFSEAVYTADSLTRCRGVSFAVTFTAHVDLSWTAGSTFEIGYAVSIDGSGPAVRRLSGMATPNSPAGRLFASVSTHHAAVYAPHVGGSARVYPAIQVMTGNVTIVTWQTELVLTAMTR
ncbi:hypothetical protein [Kitasatospora sp. NPDC058046]|uniref:hypothetical protein n=1 Tax=Kitasatospora sp. NPDC058046 TaxID=3346312 RepID=UPI0036DCAF64